MTLMASTSINSLLLTNVYKRCMCKQIFSLSEKIKKKEAENLLGTRVGHLLSRNLCCNDFKLCL